MPAAPKDPESIARAFLSAFGSSFGLSNAAGELELVNIERPKTGRLRHVVKFDQRRAGLEIIGAQVQVRLNDALAVIGVNGRLSPEGGEFQALFSEIEGVNTALSVVAKTHLDTSSQALQVSKASRVFFNPALVGEGESEELSAYRFLVTDAAGAVNHVVVIDSTSGDVLLEYHDTKDLLNRVVHDNQNDSTLSIPGPYVVRQEGDPASGISDADAAYDYSGDTYDFFFQEHGRDSLDDQGFLLRSTVRFCDPFFSCPYTNAFWNGQQMTYGEGFVSDDVVAHELTHGFTEFTSNLIYLNQSGAINESFSDFWGELVDLGNGAGDDSAGVRWSMGEDLSIGAIRHMSDPAIFGHPDRVGSANFYCGSFDNGGVHINSGVNNKAVSLLVDGGVFNGFTVNPLGVSKTADIYYQAQTAYLTNSSTFADLDLSLRASCSDLTGVGGITAADCSDLGAALDAVEMAAPVCYVPPIAQCDNEAVPSVVFSDGFETGSFSTEWEIQDIITGNNWNASTASPGSGAFSALGDDPFFVTHSALAMTTDKVVPLDGYFFFNHTARLEQSFDGGVLEYSIDAGVTWLDALDTFPVVGRDYDTTLSTSYNNPIGGREAFTGEDAYQQTRLDISSIAGQSVRFRFAIGTDISVSGIGWFIDDVSLYSCALAEPPLCNNLLVTVDLNTGIGTPTSGDDVILGTPGDDIIAAIGGNDTICGLGGNDNINAGNGNDWVDGGDGNDEIQAASGIDVVYGSAGNDLIYGGADDDELSGGDDDDSIFGNSGSDIINGDAGVDEIRGGSGDDFIFTGPGATVGSGVIVDGGSGNDTIFGGIDEDEIRGSADNDEIFGLAGNDRLYGGGGEDSVYGGADDDVIRGNAGNDYLSGDDGNDNVNGYGGKDTIRGGEGDDVLNGSTGNDVLYGDSGSDLIGGGGGNDMLDGGPDSPSDPVDVIDTCDGQGGIDTATADCEILIAVP